VLDKVNVFQETLSPCPLLNETLFRSNHHYKVLYFTLIFVLQLAFPTAISLQVLTWMQFDSVFKSSLKIENEKSSHIRLHQLCLILYMTRVSP